MSLFFRYVITLKVILNLIQDPLFLHKWEILSASWRIRMTMIKCHNLYPAIIGN